ncbi:lipocalin family protein [Pedobacter sp.]|uniref:lipocalin family protein n=1 Tax=Pedobacter sp. TaxID=1411316 RepID=UPI003D7F25CE
MKLNKWFVAIALGVIAINLSSCRSIPKGAVAVRPFDKQKYLGKWYEVARLDFKFERNLNNVTAEYSMKDNGKIRVENRGYNYKDKEWKESIGKAKFRGSSEVGRLKVSFFGPFYSPYNVLALDDNYQYALVAGKNLKYLWILSRQTTIPDNIKSAYLQKAESLGYDTGDLIWVEHNK